MNAKPKPAACLNANGFTLVELLVVVVTIAILAVMLVPALAKIKMRSTLDVCLNNQKQFATASIMFSGDHGDYLISASQGNFTGSYSDNLFPWRIEPNRLVGAPQTPTAGQTSQIFYDNYGFQTGGLYPYIKNSIIHCPADARYLGSAPGWCSYSMVDNMNGAIAVSGTDFRVHKLSQIKNPSVRMVVNEENDARSEQAPDGSTVYENQGTWEPYKPGSLFAGAGDAPNPSSNPQFISMKNGGTAGWYDGPAAFHSTGGTFSLGDGHAEFHKWQDSITLQFAFSPAAARSQYFGAVGHDTFWVYSHIATPVWP